MNKSRAIIATLAPVLFILFACPLQLSAQIGLMDGNKFRFLDRYFLDLNLAVQACSYGGNLEVAKRFLDQDRWDHAEVEYNLPEAFLKYQLYGKEASFKYIENLDHVSDSDVMFAKAWVSVMSENLDEYSIWRQKLAEVPSDPRWWLLDYYYCDFHVRSPASQRGEANLNFLIIQVDSLLQTPNALNDRYELLYSLLSYDLKTMRGDDSQPFYPEVLTLWEQYESAMVDYRVYDKLLESGDPKLFEKVPVPKVGTYSQIDSILSHFARDQDGRKVSRQLTALLKGAEDELEREKRKGAILYKSQYFYGVHSDFPESLQKQLRPRWGVAENQSYVEQYFESLRSELSIYEISVMRNTLANSDRLNAEDWVVQLGILAYLEYGLTHESQEKYLGGSMFGQQEGSVGEARQDWTKMEGYLLKNPLYEAGMFGYPFIRNLEDMEQALNTCNKVLESYPCARPYVYRRRKILEDNASIITDHKEEYFVRYIQYLVDYMFYFPSTDTYGIFLEATFGEVPMLGEEIGVFATLNNSQRKGIGDYLDEKLSLAPNQENLLQFKEKYDSLMLEYR